MNAAQFSLRRQSARQRKRHKRSEAPIKKFALQYLKYHRDVGHVWRNNTGVGFFKKPDGGTQMVKYGEKGLPDIQGYMVDGRHIGIECKASGDELTDEQTERLIDMDRCGCVCGVIFTPEDLYALVPQR